MKNKLAGLCYFSSLSIVIIDGEVFLCVKNELFWDYVLAECSCLWDS